MQQTPPPPHDDIVKTTLFVLQALRAIAQTSARDLDDATRRQYCATLQSLLASVNAARGLSSSSSSRETTSAAAIAPGVQSSSSSSSSTKRHSEHTAFTTGATASIAKRPCSDSNASNAAAPSTTAVTDLTPLVLPTTTSLPLNIPADIQWSFGSPPHVTAVAASSNAAASATSLVSAVPPLSPRRQYSSSSSSSSTLAVAASIAAASVASPPSPSSSPSPPRPHVSPVPFSSTSLLHLNHRPAAADPSSSSLSPPPPPTAAAPARRSPLALADLSHGAKVPTVVYLQHPASATSTTTTTASSSSYSSAAAAAASAAIPTSASVHDLLSPFTSPAVIFRRGYRAHSAIAVCLGSDEQEVCDFCHEECPIDDMTITSHPGSPMLTQLMCYACTLSNFTTMAFGDSGAVKPTTSAAGGGAVPVTCPLPEAALIRTLMAKHRDDPLPSSPSDDDDRYGLAARVRSTLGF